MKNKILIFTLIVLSLFSLVACNIIIDGGNGNSSNITNYETTDDYEKTIINSANKLRNSTVSIRDDQVVGSAVIISRTDSFRIYTYTAITTNEIAKKSDNYRVYGVNTNIGSKIDSFTYNDKYHYGLITFTSSAKFDVVNINEDNNTYSYNLGQTILSVGTPYDKGINNSFKTGFVTNDNYSYDNVNNHYFTHDAATNYGEFGSGVYDINGNLIGLNIYKQYKGILGFEQEYILGHVVAIDISKLVNVLKDIDFSSLSNSKLDDQLFENKEISNKIYQYNEYEQAIKNVYDNNKEYIVKVKSNNNPEYSGLLFKNTNDTYSVITVHLNLPLIPSIIELIINNKTYTTSTINVTKLNGTISIIEFKTDDLLKVYSNDTLNNNQGLELRKGQKLIGLGYLLNSTNISLSVGDLSKDNFGNEHFILHDSRLNIGQVGAPLFNLNGDLVGINLVKENSITTSTGELAAEGLGYAYNINYLANELNNGLFESLEQTKKYSFNVPYEELLVSSIDKVNNSTVTITDGNGHGSGVLVKKEEIKNSNEYRYYVLTNHHVIENSDSLNILFDDEYETIIQASDYTTVKNYDMGIVRFTSSIEFNIVESVISINSKVIQPAVGQSIISIGTPESTYKNGYVTTGSLNLEPRPYSYSSDTPNIMNLGLLQDTSINPGNSGGPIFDLYGRLIGINASKRVPFNTKDGVKIAERIGFGLNINELSKQFNKISELSYKKLTIQPKLGITVLNLKSDEIILENTLFKDYYKLGENVFRVEAFDRTRNGDKFFNKGDYLYKLNDTRITDMTDISGAIANGNVNDKYKFTILRVLEDGTITLIEVYAELS